MLRKISALKSTLCACVMALTFAGTAQAVSVSGQGTWESTLQGRDLDGNLATFEAWYDTALDITWLADANYTGVYMNWTSANNWATNLDPYGSGITGWRLPIVTNGESGVDIDPAGSEMAHMFYVTLGNWAYTASNQQPGWGLSNTGPFTNLVGSEWWSGTQHEYLTDEAWYFEFYSGQQHYYNQSFPLLAWAVHQGDVGASAAVVPVPAAAWLLGSGLLGLLGMQYRKFKFPFR